MNEAPEDEVKRLREENALLREEVESLTAQLAVDKMHAEHPEGCPVCTHMSIEQNTAWCEAVSEENLRLRAAIEVLEADRVAKS